MTVTVTIHIDQPDPVVPRFARAEIAYGDGNVATTTWHLLRSVPVSPSRCNDTYERTTAREDGSERHPIEVTVSRNDVRDLGYVPNHTALAREVVEYLSLVLETAILIDMETR